MVDLQAALALALAPGEVFLGVGARGVAVFRLACLVALGGIVFGGDAFVAGIFAGEQVVQRAEVV